LDAATLKQLDALLFGHDYPDAVLEKIAPHVTAYLEAAAKLRQVPLGETKGAFVMLAGGKR
jgi:hypothetical protein